jgi:hypothetical protein
MLEKLRSAGLQADIKKNEFSVTKTKFLKYIISTNGITVDPDKVSELGASHESQKTPIIPRIL